MRWGSGRSERALRRFLGISKIEKDMDQRDRLCPAQLKMAAIMSMRMRAKAVINPTGTFFKCCCLASVHCNDDFGNGIFERCDDDIADHNTVIVATPILSLHKIHHPFVYIFVGETISNTAQSLGLCRKVRFVVIIVPREFEVNLANTCRVRRIA